jgi:hypothetical protein
MSLREIRGRAIHSKPPRVIPKSRAVFGNRWASPDACTDGVKRRRSARLDGRCGCIVFVEKPNELIHDAARPAM